jgi:hypothetical protein
MNDDEAELAAQGWELRLAEAERGSEIWFTAQPEFLLAADVLHSKGWLERRSGPRIEFRLSDRGLAALRVDAATTGQCMN